MRTVITFDNSTPPAEFKVKLCGGNHVEPGEEILIKNGANILGVRWVSEIYPDHYTVTNNVSIAGRTVTRPSTRAACLRAAWELRNEGVTIRDIALILGVSHGTAWNFLQEAKDLEEVLR